MFDYFLKKSLTLLMASQRLEINPILFNDIKSNEKKIRKHSSHILLAPYSR